MENIHVGWKSFIDENKDKIEIILNKVYEDKKLTIYPKKEDIFKTLFYFPPEEIKLVLLGQDCYHGFEILDDNKIPQACGLAFSVSKKIKKIPPSLQNIYKELKNCVDDFIIPKHGSLKRWIKEEKILLLNSALTVIEKTPNSHATLWMQLTDDLIKFISEKNNKTIFLLLGAFAQKKETLIVRLLEDGENFT
jgi:uracil-DNA glycosylase